MRISERGAQRARRSSRDLDAFHKRMLRELNRIEDYYQAAGESVRDCTTSRA